MIGGFMNQNEIRSCLYNYLKQSPETQVLNILDYFINKVGTYEKNKDRQVLLDIIHELITNNILRPGSNYTYPFLRLTEYGRKCIEEENLLPFDPEDYIKEIKKQIPNIDNIALIYLSESISTYNRNCLLSSTITLGAASEQAMLLLIDAFVDSVQDSEKKERLQNEMEKNLFIYSKYKIFKAEFNKIKKNLPEALTKNVETYLEGIFGFIRLNRNEAGHPTGTKVNKKIIYSNLQIFAEYGKRIFELIEHFKVNSM